jgi:branched-chain amino acid aminotransferase
MGDQVVFLEDHLDRLERGAKMIGLTLPFTRSKIGNWIKQANSSHKSRIKKIRVTVTAGDSEFWAGEDSLPRIIVIVTEYAIPTRPFHLSVSPYRVDQGSPFRNVKTLSFIIEMTSRKEAHYRRFDDSILLNRSGYVAETTSANIFWIKAGCLYTTPINAGCLEGMTRKHILEVASKNNISNKVKNVRLKDLVKADEIFITSSIKLILPVSAVTAKQKTFKYRTGLLTRRLQELLWKRIMSGR